MIIEPDQKTDNHFPTSAPPSHDGSNTQAGSEALSLYAPSFPRNTSTFSSSSSNTGALQPPPYAPEYARSRASVSTSAGPSHSSFYSPPSTPNPSSTPRPEFPASFSRSPPPHIPYPIFQPMFLVARGKYLTKGFLPVPPPSTVHPHPFTSHDVHEHDWFCFLDELKEAGALTKKQLEMSDLPIIRMVPIVNIIVGHGIRAYMKSTKGHDVAQAVDRWNHHFFHPRRMQVILMRGQAKLSGQKDRPIPNLYTPETVDASNMPNNNFSFSAAGESTKSLPVKGKNKEERGEDKDQTYRLFVVPL